LLVLAILSLVETTGLLDSWMMTKAIGGGGSRMASMRETGAEHRDKMAKVRMTMKVT
jgi:hypothetical protein